MKSDERSILLKVDYPTYKWIKQMSLDWDISVKKLILAALSEYESNHANSRPKG